MTSREILNAKRMRLICGLSQFDVCVGAGLKPHRLSAAENGRLQLCETEMTALTGFLREYWNSVCVRERQIYATGNDDSFAELSGVVTA